MAIGQRPRKGRGVRNATAALLVAIASLLIVAPCAQAQNEPGNIHIVNAQKKPSREYLAFSDAFNAAFIELWRETNRSNTMIQQAWGVFLTENSDGIAVVAISDREGTRPVLADMVRPSRRSSRIAAEAAARRAMRLIIAEEARKRRGER